MGTSPTKFAQKFFLIFGKILSPKKSKKFFFDFGSKNYADRCNLVSGVRQKSFFVQKKNLKKFRFLDLVNFQKFFKKC